MKNHNFAMKINGFILLAITIFNTGSIISQSANVPCACCSENYNQFDFWLGEWDVYNINEKLVGTNTITKQL